MVVKAFSDIGRIFARRTVAINAGLVVDGKSRPCLLIPELWPCLHRAALLVTEWIIVFDKYHSTIGLSETLAATASAAPATMTRATTISRPERAY